MSGLKGVVRGAAEVAGAGGSGKILSDVTVDPQQPRIYRPLDTHFDQGLQAERLHGPTHFILVRPFEGGQSTNTFTFTPMSGRPYLDISKDVKGRDLPAGKRQFIDMRTVISSFPLDRYEPLDKEESDLLESDEMQEISRNVEKKDSIFRNILNSVVDPEIKDIVKRNMDRGVCLDEVAPQVLAATAEKANQTQPAESRTVAENGLDKTSADLAKSDPDRTDENLIAQPDGNEQGTDSNRDSKNDQKDGSKPRGAL